jgi:hypothetical protein
MSTKMRSWQAWSNPIPIKETPPTRSNLGSDVQLGLAVFSLVILILSPLMFDSKTPIDLKTSISIMFVANALILAAGGGILLSVEQILSNRVSDPEIRRVARDANTSSTPKNTNHNSTYLLIVVSALAAIPIVILLTVSFVRIKDTAGCDQYSTSLMCRVLRLSLFWLWRVPAALAIVEAIYIAWASEALLMKAELQNIARKWIRLSAQTAARTEIPPDKPLQQSEGQNETAPDTSGWMSRTRYLISELRRRGLEIEPASLEQEATNPSDPARARSVAHYRPSRPPVSSGIRFSRHRLRSTPPSSYYAAFADLLKERVEDEVRRGLAEERKHLEVFVQALVKGRERAKARRHGRAAPP